MELIMLTLAQYMDIQNNCSLIQDSELSMNMFSHGFACTDGRWKSNDESNGWYTYYWRLRNKGNWQRENPKCIQMIAWRLDRLQRCTNSNKHTENNFGNSKWQLPSLDFWKQELVISLTSNQLQSSSRNRTDQHFKFPLHRRQRRFKIWPHFNSE